MKYGSLGSTGLQVSQVILGCGSFGGVGADRRLVGKGASRAEAFEVLDAAMAMGINCLDTSNAYGGGASEAIVGDWLASKGAAFRDEVIVSTKVHHPVADGPNDRGLSRRHILRQVENSLRRLKVDYIDLYIPHSTDYATPVLETLGALDDLVRAGKVRYLGVSQFPAWLLTRALWLSSENHLQRFQWVQESFSLLDRRVEMEILPACLALGLGFTPYSPLGAGILARDYSPAVTPEAGSRVQLSPNVYGALLNDESFADLAVLRATADEVGVSTAALSLAWILNLAYRMNPIVGARRVDHLKAVATAVDLDLAPDVMDRLSALFPTSPGIPHGNGVMVVPAVAGGLKRDELRHVAGST